MSRGLLVAIVAPSGGGKTTVVSELLRQTPSSVRFVTSTTRSPRPSEKNGIDYHFLTRSEFAYKITEGELIEYVTFAENFYGTDRIQMEKLLATHDFVFVAIDVKGSDTYKALSYPYYRIFLMPESMEVIRERLSRRPGISAAEVERRLGPAQAEIDAASRFDAIVQNREGRLAETVAEVKALLTAKAK